MPRFDCLGKLYDFLIIYTRQTNIIFRFSTNVMDENDLVNQSTFEWHKFENTVHALF